MSNINVTRGNQINYYLRSARTHLDSVADIVDNNGNLLFAIFPGSLGQRPESDIILTYYSKKHTLRTIKHTQWVADLLMKIQGDSKLATSFIKELLNIWNNATIISSRDWRTIKGIVDNGCNSVNLSKYKKLSSFGFYNVETIFVTVILLSHEEKIAVLMQGI